MQTHETYIAAVAKAVIAFAELTPTERTLLNSIKLVYGSGPDGTRGVTFYNRFKPAGCDDAVPFVEISAFGQSSLVQITGTTVHELGHVLAGWNAGHGPDWKLACERLGLRKIKAAGTNYCWANFSPVVRTAVTQLEAPREGQPVSSIASQLGRMGIGAAPRFKPCGAGIGTRGGTSRGKGSGSRLRLYECECGQKIRASTDSLDAVHNPCGSAFVCK